MSDVCKHGVTYALTCLDCCDETLVDGEVPKCPHGVPNEHGFCAQCDAAINDLPPLAPYVLYIEKADFDKASEAGKMKIYGGAFTVEPHIWDYPLDMEGNTEPHHYYRITLQPGTHLEYEWGGEHEEGYSYSGREVKVDWNHDGDLELWSDEQSTRSSDCDGPHESYYDKWSDGLPYEETDSSYHAGFPDRSRCLKESRRQRDTFAERMGY